MQSEPPLLHNFVENCSECLLSTQCGKVLDGSDQTTTRQNLRKQINYWTLATKIDGLENAQQICFAKLKVILQLLVFSSSCRILFHSFYPAIPHLPSFPTTLQAGIYYPQFLHGAPSLWLDMYPSQ